MTEYLKRKKNRFQWNE